MSSIEEIRESLIFERDELRARVGQLEDGLKKAREQFAYIEREAYSDNQAGRTIHACRVAFDAIDAILAREQA